MFFWLMAVIFGLWVVVFWLAYLSFSDCWLFGCCFWLMGRGLLVISYKAITREAAAVGKGAEKMPPRPIYRGAPRTQKEAKRLPKEAPDDGSDALPKCNQIFVHFRAYFSSENDPKNEPEIVKKYIQLKAKLFYYCSYFLPTRSVSVIRKIVEKHCKYQ